jgi:hypothetical protein
LQQYRGHFTDDVRLEKIDRLKKSLAENTYHVSSADLAQKIIDHLLQFELRNREGAIANWRRRLHDNFAKPMPFQTKDPQLD